VLGTVLIDALHAPLEHREVALNRVRVDDAAHVFLLAVVHGLMLNERFAELAILTGFVGHDTRFPGDVLLLRWSASLSCIGKDGDQRFGFQVVHDDGAGLARLAIHISYLEN
jgi:hypothetical protein